MSDKPASKNASKSPRLVLSKETLKNMVRTGLRTGGLVRTGPTCYPTVVCIVETDDCHTQLPDCTGVTAGSLCIK